MVQFWVGVMRDKVPSITTGNPGPPSKSADEWPQELQSPQASGALLQCIWNDARLPSTKRCFTCQSDMAPHRGWPAHTSAARHARTARKQRTACEHLTMQPAYLASAVTETKPFQSGVGGLFRSRICHFQSVGVHMLPRGETNICTQPQGCWGC